MHQVFRKTSSPCTVGTSSPTSLVFVFLYEELLLYFSGLRKSHDCQFHTHTHTLSSPFTMSVTDWLESLVWAMLSRNPMKIMFFGQSEKRRITMNPTVRTLPAYSAWFPIFVFLNDCFIFIFFDFPWSPKPLCHLL